MCFASTCCSVAACAFGAVVGLSVVGVSEVPNITRLDEFAASVAVDGTLPDGDLPPHAFALVVYSVAASCAGAALGLVLGLMLVASTSLGDEFGASSARTTTEGHVTSLVEVDVFACHCTVSGLPMAEYDGRAVRV